jgi:hypothetical protein
MSHGHNRVSHENVTHYPQSQQHQQQLSQPSGVSMSAWDHAGQGRGVLAVADPWGRPFSSGGEIDSDQSPMNGNASWSHASAQPSALNGWGGAPNRNFQQHQQHLDHRISQYVIGLPAEIINQARVLTPTTSARSMLCLVAPFFCRSACYFLVRDLKFRQARIMDNIYMHLNVAWSAMNYGNIAYFAGELHKISTLLYQVRVLSRVFLCCVVRSLIG